VAFVLFDTGPISFIRCALTQYAVACCSTPAVWPRKLSRVVNDFITMKVFHLCAPLFSSPFAGANNKKLINESLDMVTMILQTLETKCMCAYIYVVNLMRCVFIFLIFVCGCFCIDLPQSFVFKMQHVRPRASLSARDSVTPFHTMGAIS
jgi:hypothetical protein